MFFLTIRSIPYFYVNWHLIFVEKFKSLDIRYLFLAFFIPVITHAIYNFSGDIALQFLIIIILSFQVKKLHRQFIKHQSNKKTEAEIKLL